MSQTVIITIAAAGTDTGPFNLFSDADAYVTAFATGIAKSALLAGYTSTVVPDAATIVRVKSNSVGCTNYVDMEITSITTYCESIGAGAGCFNWDFTAGSEGAIVQWTDCDGNNQSRVLTDGESGNACLCDGYEPTVLEGSLPIKSQVGQCSPPPEEYQIDNSATGTSGDACTSSTTTSIVWAESGNTVPMVGLILYTTTNPLANPFVGSVGWRKLTGPLGTYAVEINTSGEITNYVTC